MYNEDLDSYKFRLCKTTIIRLCISEVHKELTIIVRIYSMQVT